MHTAGLGTLRHMGIFIKHPMVYIKTAEHSLHTAGLASQVKQGEYCQIQTEYQEIAHEAPKFGNMCPTPEQDFQIHEQTNNFDVHVFNDQAPEGLEGSQDAVQGLSNQMDALSPQPAIYDVGFLQKSRGSQIMYHQRLTSTSIHPY